ncbi:MAG: DNA repair protein RadA [Acidimicrobiaceae bacterium]|nr:DNA repair protein RadA [Acidimicrobiaceae bacterium]
MTSTDLHPEPTTLRAQRRPRTDFACTACGATQPTWAGRCPGCGEWNTLEEVVGRAMASAAVATTEAVPLADVPAGSAVPAPTGCSELDRALGGGLVPGSVTLLGGEPGIGKSTLTLQVAAGRARAGGRALLVSAEESAAQVRRRAERLGVLEDGLWLAGDADLGSILAHLDRLSPDLLVVDSIQTVHDPDVTGAPGSVAQVRACAHRLVVEAKRRGTTVLLVGHVTKEGSLAGPKVLEHVVDTVADLVGDRHHALRLLRVAKHRFGPTDELGLFAMEVGGLAPVEDPGRLFLADRAVEASGSAVLPAMEGRRPLLVELQALVVRATTPHPRRSSQGVDPRRLALLLAVLDRRAGLELGALDVYVTAVGGVQVTEPGADLPLALAVASALTGRRLGADSVACGEIGLGGEVRQVAHLERRLQEAHRLGFRRAVLPQSAPAGPDGLEVVRVRTLAEAVAATGLLGDGTAVGD